jgi:antirestriction protein ArdC
MTTTKTEKRTDLYTTITKRIVHQLEAGACPWHRPWNAKHKAGSISRPLRNNGQPYQGVNVLVLWLTAYEKGYSSPLWLTFQQAREAGGFVKKGEKGTQVVYANTFEKKDKDATTGEETVERIPFLKSYIVFNAEQVEGLPGHYYALAEAPRNLAERLQHAEEFFANTKAKTEHGGNRAYYSISSDQIQLPPYETFEDRESYYSTRAHESIHWTKTPTRMNRDFGGKRFGDDGYAMEELVAELGAAFLCADLGITADVRVDHASYLDSWLKVMKADSKAIFTAASQASRAVEFLHGLQPKTETVPEVPTEEPQAPIPPKESETPADPTGDFLDMFAAMHDEDFGHARELALRLRSRARDGQEYPKFYSREEVDSYVASVLRRTESVGTA